MTRMSTILRLLMACLRGVRRWTAEPFFRLPSASFKRSPRRIWRISSFRAMRDSRVTQRPTPRAGLLDTGRDHSHIGHDGSGEVNEQRIHAVRSAQVRTGARMNRRDFLVAGAGAGAVGLIRAKRARGESPRLG